MSAPTPDLQRRPELFTNRELSLLAFDARVLAQAEDEGLPLLERLRFLTIASANLDEFFEIRVAGLVQQAAHGLQQVGPDGLSPQEQLRLISAECHRIVAVQYKLLNEVLLPRLEQHGVRVLRRAHWNDAQRAWVQCFFREQVLPVLTPVGLDPAHPFPRLLNKGLSFVVEVEGTDAFGRSSGVAVLQVPRSLPRVLRMPAGVAQREHDFVLLSSVIHANVGELFQGMKVGGCHQFRVTRNGDLWVDEEEVEDLLQALKGELSSRNFGQAVRLEVADTCEERTAAFLLKRLNLTPNELYRVHGPVNLNRLAAIYDLVDRPALKFPAFVPGMRRELRDADLFAVLRRRDVLLHHPYESFAPVTEFLRQASTDPAVLAIKQTVYRTDVGSPLVESLISAARAGKEVTAVVELRARFDEAHNIDLATRLQQAGANVVYGVVGYKTHAKMLLVVRRESGQLRRYFHLGTGNYHPGTARAYTDFGLLSCHPELGQDVHGVFNQLTGLGKVGTLHQLVQAPFTLLRTLHELIEREAEEARAGRPARIVAKMNSLSEPSVIAALYRASQAGVEIDLIVRGICRLRPGVPGVSETIRVRSIVGRFLEHSRIYAFHAGGEERVYLSSADWMERNLLRRVEACFPVLDPELRQRVREEGLESYLADDRRAWLLGADGAWQRARAAAPRRDAQLELLAGLSHSVEVELQADSGEQGGLVLEVRSDERVLGQPPGGEDELEGSGSAA